MVHLRRMFHGTHRGAVHVGPRLFFHSVALALLVSLFVLGQAYVWPLTALVP